jgi:type I restriction enzyme S subunit
MSEWTRQTLAEVADIRISNVDKKETEGQKSVRLCNYMDVYSNSYIERGMEFMEATASQEEITKFKVSKGDVLITKDSETPFDIGIPSVVVDEIQDLVCGYHLALIKPDQQKVDSIFLSKILASKASASYFSRLAAGSTRYGLSSGAIAETPLSIPGLVYQKKVAGILETLDRAIEKIDSLVKKYRQIKIGLMHDLFTRGVGPDGKLRRSREEAPELYQDTAVGCIPRDWELKLLREMARPGVPHIKTGPFGSSLKGEHWVDEGVPVITIGALGEGRFISEELLHISDFYASFLTDYRMKVGEVVFSRVADVGRSVVIGECQDGWVMSSNLMRLHLSEDAMDPKYLQESFAYDFRIKGQIRRKVNSGGRDVANSEILNSILFLCPPIEEQRQIVHASQAISRKIELEQAQLGKLIKQKLGLMHDLLTAKASIEVKPDARPKVAHV